MFTEKDSWYELHRAASDTLNACSQCVRASTLVALPCASVDRYLCGCPQWGRHTFITLQVPTLAPAKMPTAKTKIDLKCIIQEVLVAEEAYCSQSEQYVEHMKKVDV